MQCSRPALNLHVEFKPLLSIVNVSLEFSKHILASTVRLTIDTQSITVEEEVNNYTFQLKGLTLNPASCRSLRWGSARELQFTLKVQDDQKGDGLMNGYAHHVANQDVLVSRIQACQSHCYCVGCGAHILKSSCHFKRVLPLPSENWSDFADIWFCHNHSHSHKNVDTDESQPSPPEECESHEEDTSHFKSMSLRPRLGDCLVSSLYMLADGSHFKSSSLACFEDRLMCKRCGNFLGFVKDEPDTKQQGHQSPGTFKIYFHAINFRINSEKEESPEKEPINSYPLKNNGHNKHRVEEFLCGLLKDQCRIFTSFRFILTSSQQANDKNSISVLLWLLDQNLTVFLSRVAHQLWKQEQSPKSPHPVSPSKHLKLLYKVSFNFTGSSHPLQSSDSQSANVFQAWHRDNTVQALSLPYPLCKQLIQFLLSSTKQLAPSQRSLNGFHVGYLKAS